jgi:nucleoid DNA-binding protein
MLSKNEIAEAVSAKCGVGKNLVKSVMDAMSDVATEQITRGEDFSVPGIARVSYAFSKPYRKGEKYIDPFTKEELTRTKNQAAKIRIRATPAPAIKRLVKGSSANSKTFKAVASRKG